MAIIIVMIFAIFCNHWQCNCPCCYWMFAFFVCCCCWWMLGNEWWWKSRQQQPQQLLILPRNCTQMLLASEYRWRFKKRSSFPTKYQTGCSARCQWQIFSSRIHHRWGFDSVLSWMAGDCWWHRVPIRTYLKRCCSLYPKFPVVLPLWAERFLYSLALESCSREASPGMFYNVVYSRRSGANLSRLISNLHYSQDWQGSIIQTIHVHYQVKHDSQENHQQGCRWSGPLVFPDIKNTWSWPAMSFHWLRKHQGVRIHATVHCSTGVLAIRCSKKKGGCCCRANSLSVGCVGGSVTVL